MADYQVYKPEQVKQSDAFAAYKQNPNKDTQRAVLLSLQKTINNAITSFGRGDKKLKTRAYILAKDALDKYDPKSNAALNTYVYSSLRKLSRVYEDRNNAVKTPEGARLDKHKINTFMSEFNDSKGREPSVVEIADGTGLSQKRVNTLNNTLKYEGSYSSNVSQETGDFIGGKEVDDSDAWSDYVYEDLDNVDRKIFEWTTGYNGMKTLPKKEIAKKLKISAPAVSQRVNKIIGRLESGLSTQLKNI